MFGGSAPIFPGNMNNFFLQREPNLYNSVSPNPQIANLIIELMNNSNIKEQKVLHNSLVFIYGVNDKIQNQSVPNMLIKKDNNQNNINNNNQHMSAIIQSNYNFNNQQEEEYVSIQNDAKQNINIFPNTSNNGQSSFQIQQRDNNIGEESIKNETKAPSKVHNSFSNNKVYSSGKYNTVQPPIFYDTQGYNGNTVENKSFNKNIKYQYTNPNNINNSTPIQTAKNYNFQ